jgi:hypothetical protein
VSRSRITGGGAVGAGGVGGPPLIAVVTTQFDKINATLTNVPGLTFNVVAGRTYKFEALLYATSSGLGGSRYAIGGTATATSLIVRCLILGDIGNPSGVTRTITALATMIAQENFNFGEPLYVTLTGTIVVNASGTLTVQFAQNTTDAVASSVLVGSTFELQAIS